MSDHPVAIALGTPLYVIAIAIVSLIVSIAAAIVQRGEKRSESLTLAVVVLIQLVMLLTLATTGGTSSAYDILWVIAGLFCGICGFRSLLPTIVLIVTAFAYIVLTKQPDFVEAIVLATTIFVPAAIGGLLWRSRLKSKDHSSAAVSVLAHELSQESNKSGIIINAIADGVIVINGQGVIDLINPAAQQIIGWGKEDAVKLDYRSVLKIVNGNEQPVDDTTDPVQACFHTNQPVLTDKLNIKTVSGKKLMASILVSPLGDTAAGAIIIFRDITSQNAEEREQAEFISTASHEMRTPVASIEGYLGLALNPQTAVIDDKARAFLEKAHEAAQHLGRLFQDLLDISRVEDGRLKSAPRILDTTAQTRVILTDFIERYREKGINLAFKPDQAQGASQQILPIFYTRVDADHFREVLGNLVENALKYTKEGTVTVDVTGDSERVMVDVTDSGLGIPAEDISHLFQKFYRVDNSDTREIGGTGLGLYLSRRLAETMGGQLTVESEYGKGSTFKITLPRLSTDEATAELQKLTATEQPAT